MVADRAVAAVSKIGADCGWACDTVRSDYGDDLLVQTSFRERIDPYRISIQIKGTQRSGRYRAKSGGFSFPVKKKHLVYWMRNRGIVIFVLWDVVKECGWYAIPRYQYKEYEIETARSATLRLELSQPFDRAAAASIAWLARLDHYDAHLVAAAHEDEVALFNEEIDGTPSGHVSRKLAVAVELLTVLEICEQRGDTYDLAETFRIELAKALANCKDEAMSVAELLTLLLIKHVEDVTGHGAQHAIVLAASDAIVVFLPPRIQESLEMSVPRLVATLGRP